MCSDSFWDAVFRGFPKVLFINSLVLVSRMKRSNRREPDRKTRQIILKVNELIFNNKNCRHSLWWFHGSMIRSACANFEWPTSMMTIHYVPNHAYWENRYLIIIVHGVAMNSVLVLRNRQKVDKVFLRQVAPAEIIGAANAAPATPSLWPESRGMIQANLPALLVQSLSEQTGHFNECIFILPWVLSSCPICRWYLLRR